MKKSRIPSARKLSGSLSSLLLALATVSAMPAAAEEPAGETMTAPADATPAPSAGKAGGATAGDAASEDKTRPSSPCAPKKKKRKSPCAIGG